METIRLGGLWDGATKHQAGSVWDKNLIAPTIDTMQGGGREPMIIDDTYANRQPRVYEDYSPALRSEREGLKTIENVYDFYNNNLKSDGVCGALTSACSHNGSGTFGVIETYSSYVNQKYKEFQEENGYIPEYFNPYNKTELTDVAPTLTAQGESVTKSSTVLKCDTQYRIRKLTPKECWRLMDFTDEDFEKAAQVNSNTQLYKQAGNSIIRNVLVAILGQLIEGKEDAYRKV